MPRPRSRAPHASEASCGVRVYFIYEFFGGVIEYLRDNTDNPRLSDFYKDFYDFSKDIVDKGLVKYTEIIDQIEAKRCNYKKAKENLHVDHILVGLMEFLSCSRWYRRWLSPSLSNEEKGNLMRRIYDLSVEMHGLGDRNYPVEKFPELTKYTRRESLSGLELIIIKNELYRELRGGGDEPTNLA